MHKFSIVLLSILMLSFSGCTKNQIGCAVENTLAGAASQAIATGLQCTNADAITTSLKVGLAKLNLCAAPDPSHPTLALPAALCQSVADVAVGAIAGGVIPTAWGCSAQMAQDQLKALIVKACSGS